MVTIHDACEQAYKRGFEDGKRSATEWKSVSEPPEEDGEYIVMIKNGASATTLLYSDDGFWFEEDEDGYQTYYAVTHWMPMPEPPKGE